MKTELTAIEESTDLENEIMKAIFRILDDLSQITGGYATYDSGAEEFSEGILEQMQQNKIIPNLLRNLRRYF